MAMYRTGIKSSCTIRHKLEGDFGEETVPHEHRYDIEWICTVSGLDENGFGVNIDILKDNLAVVVSEIEGRYLNDLPYFENRQASIENTASYLSDRLLSLLTEGGYPLDTMLKWEILIWEADDAWASFIQESLG
jgi:6-pyruvoyltetrahydropterin/6-carboxytetrahydropterin synthase